MSSTDSWAACSAASTCFEVSRSILTVLGVEAKTAPLYQVVDSRGCLTAEFRRDADLSPRRFSCSTNDPTCTIFADVVGVAWNDLFGNSHVHVTIMLSVFTALCDDLWISLVLDRTVKIVKKCSRWFVCVPCIEPECEFN